MKIATVLGTRPEIIRLSRVVDRLDALCEHLLVFTGQNFHRSLSDIFFDQLGVRRPDVDLQVRGESLADQVAQILTGTERVFREQRPDRLLVLGDTNSSLCALIAKRMGIPVYHMEAGNRCYDDRVPEEVNRRVIDHSSDVLMPYTERSRANLLREGIASDRIFVTGNPINEVIEHHAGAIAASDALAEIGVEPGRYFLVTLHRAENVDAGPRLEQLAESLVRVNETHDLPVVVSTHPRLRSRMEAMDLDLRGRDVRFPDPFGFFDFVTLERNAACVLTDSGTVQEECAIFRIPNVTIRDVTERPETIECGSNMLSGAAPADVLRCVATALSRPPAWDPPPEYLAPRVSDTVARIVLGFQLERLAR